MVMDGKMVGTIKLTLEAGGRRCANNELLDLLYVKLLAGKIDNWERCLCIIHVSSEVSHDVLEQPLHRL